MSLEIRAVIFDLGRVLVDFDNMKTCQGLAEFCGHSAEEISALLFGSRETKKPEEFMKFEQGLLTPVGFYEGIKYQLAAADLKYSDFYTIWGDILSPNPGIENLLARLRRDVLTFVLSNNDWIRWRFVEHLPVIRRFFSQREQLILSFQLHARKPDQQMFLEGIRRAGVKPDRIIYVDDVPAFVDAARNLGMVGILYDCRIDPINYLEQRFSRLGVI